MRIARTSGWRRIAAGLAALALPALAAPALAGQAETEASGETPPAHPWQITAAVRGTVIHDAALDPFSNSDTLADASLSVVRELWRRDRLSLAAGASFGGAEANARARSASSSLSLKRLLLPVEVRFAVHPRGYLFGRVAPGVLFANLNLDDASAPAPLSAKWKTLATDVGGGAAVAVNGPYDRFRLWAVLEGGYGFTPRHEVVLAPDLSDADQNKAGSVALPALAARGLFAGLGLALAF